MALPKPADKRQRRNDRGDVGLLSPAKGPVAIPLPLQEWGRETVNSWREYWTSPVSSLVEKQSDLDAVYRLFDYRDEHRKAMKAYRQERLTFGSTGQPKASPYFDIATRLEKLIVPLEDRYGLSSLARLRLGASLGEATRSLADMNALVPDDSGVNDDDNEEQAVVVDLPGLPKQG